MHPLPCLTQVMHAGIDSRTLDPKQCGSCPPPKLFTPLLHCCIVLYVLVVVAVQGGGCDGVAESVLWDVGNVGINVSVWQKPSCLLRVQHNNTQYRTCCCRNTH